jgi:hypothetical protein
MSGGVEAGKVAMLMTLGGTVSAISGGSFANGALSTAFQIMFNDMEHAAVSISKECKIALATAHQDYRAIKRAKAHWAVLQKAAKNVHNVSAAFLGAIGVRESGFKVVREIGGGPGVGVFQLTVAPGWGVTSQQASSLEFSANYACANACQERSSTTSMVPVL